MNPPSVIAKTRIANRALPLVATLGRSEREVAAAMIVLVLAQDGDTWRPVIPQETGAALKAALELPEYKCFRNPLLRPDFHDLVAKGFAKFLETPPVAGTAIEFTEAGLIAIGAMVAP